MSAGNLSTVVEAGGAPLGSSKALIGLVLGLLALAHVFLARRARRTARSVSGRLELVDRLVAIARILRGGDLHDLVDPVRQVGPSLP